MNKDKRVRLFASEQEAQEVADAERGERHNPEPEQWGDEWVVTASWTNYYGVGMSIVLCMDNCYRALDNAVW